MMKMLKKVYMKLISMKLLIIEVEEIMINADLNFDYNFAVRFLTTYEQHIRKNFNEHFTLLF